ncbi:MAG TPA: DHA2 family efflux MFS transporter permease subunit [bacterium]|jgi:DHA2 family multidrug resistance protein|nr:DHA2 family efflux MFS transporter permease subunit [bacterium]
MAVGTLTPAAAVPARRYAGKYIVALSVLFGSVMAAIDTSVVNVALAHIQASYGVTLQEVTWVSTSYLIAVVIVMPLTAWFASVLGRKRFYILSVAVFTVASAFCGFSRTLGQLIFFRVLQGLGGGALQPIAQSIMRETFPPEEQGQAMGFFGMVVLLGPAIGPTLGGWLTDNWSWPWIFFVNLPIGALALFMASSFIVDPPYMRGRGLLKFDGVGIGLLAVGLASLQILLEEGERDGWFASTFIVVLTVIAVVVLTAFVLWELRTPTPAVNLRILSDLTYAAGTTIIGVLGLALFGSLILLPLFLQNLLGYTATQAGLTLMPRSLVMVVMMPVAGFLYNKLGVRVMLPFGLAVSGTAGLMMSHFTTSSSHLGILVPQIIQGVGFSFMFIPLSTATLSTIPRPLMQSATGLFNLVRQLGGSLGTALVITLLDHKVTTASANLVRYASLSNPVFMSWWSTIQAGLQARGSDAVTAHQQALAVLRMWIAQQSAVVAFDYVFALVGAVFIVCLPVVLLIRDRDLDQMAARAAAAAAD